MVDRELVHGRGDPAGGALGWLLEENQPAIRHRALLDLVGLAEDHPDVRKARSLIPTRGWARDILRKQQSTGHWVWSENLYWPKYTATNWMALILSDLGLTKDDPRVSKAAGLFLDQWMDEKKDNIFKDEVCIVGNAARFMTRFGYLDDPRVRRLFDRLVEDQKKDGGWHCHDSTRGTLDCWEALAAFAAVPETRRTAAMRSAVEHGVEFYLQRKLFREGPSKYRPWFRLHYPNHYYYDILVGLDVVTSLGYAGDRRLKPALETLRRKRRGGKWLLERVHPDPPSFAWGKHNLRHPVTPFALEKVGRPSKMITLRALTVLKRVEDSGAS